MLKYIRPTSFTLLALVYLSSGIGATAEGQDGIQSANGAAKAPTNVTIPKSAAMAATLVASIDTDVQLSGVDRTAAGALFNLATVVWSSRMI